MSTSTSGTRVGPLQIDRDAYRSLQAFFEASAPHRIAVRDELLVLSRAHSELAPILQSIPQETLDQQDREQREMERLAFFEKDWEPLTESLRRQGAEYARLGMSFASWYEIVSAYKSAMIPRLVEDMKGEPERLTEALLGLCLRIDFTMPLIAEAYIDVRTDELRRLNEALNEANRRLDQFVYVASHDLKAPLRAIEDLAEWISEDLADSDIGETAENLGLLRNRVRRLGSMIDALLRYSRAGRGEGRVETVRVERLLDDVKMLASLPEHIELRVIGKPPTLRTHRVPLRHVLLNLIVNAAKHHDREHGVIEVSARRDGDVWEFTVSDDGPGIPDKFHDKVFEAFRTLRPLDEVEGTGIGLAIVKRTVETIGGRVVLENNEPRGARFRFTWPEAEEAQP